MFRVGQKWDLPERAAAESVTFTVNTNQGESLTKNEILLSAQITPLPASQPASQPADGTFARPLPGYLSQLKTEARRVVLNESAENNKQTNKQTNKQKRQSKYTENNSNKGSMQTHTEWVKEISKHVP